jgi:hypothetical protein
MSMTRSSTVVRPREPRSPRALRCQGSGTRLPSPSPVTLAKRAVEPDQHQRYHQDRGDDAGQDEQVGTELRLLGLHQLRAEPQPSQGDPDPERDAARRHQGDQGAGFEAARHAHRPRRGPVIELAGRPFATVQ